MATFTLPFSKMEICVINDPNLSAKAKILYGILVFLARQRSSLKLPYCQVSINTLCSLMKRKTRTIQICLNELITHGVIIREAKYIDTPEGERRQVASLFYVLGSHCQTYRNHKTSGEGFHFAMVSARVLFDPDLTINEKFLFVTLCHLANMENDTINTYVRTLSERMGVSMSVVYRGLATLNKKGFLDIIPRFVGKTSGRSASTYVVNRTVALPDDIDDTTDHMGAIFDKDLLRISAGEVSRTYYYNISTKDDNLIAKNGRGGHSNQVNPTINPEHYHTYRKAKAIRISPNDLRIPGVMQSVVQHLINVTSRTFLYESELHSIYELNKIHTPIRIREEINRAAERFIKSGKPLSHLLLQYIYSSLKNQEPTYQPQRNKKAQEAIDLDRANEKERRKELLNNRYAKKTADKQEAQASTDDLNWTNPVSTISLSPSEAQETLAMLKSDPIFKRTHQFAKIASPAGDSETSVTSYVSPLDPQQPQKAQNPVNSVNREKILDYLAYLFPGENVQCILKNTLEGFSQSDIEDRLRRFQDSLIQLPYCTSCQGLANCPSCGFKHEISTYETFGADKKTKFFVGNEKCDKLLEKEKFQRDYLKFSTALKNSGLTPDQYSHTIDTIDASIHPEVANAVAAAIDALSKNSWLCLTGYSGTGKTRIATGIALSAMAQGKSALLITASDMLSSLLKFQDKTHITSKQKYEKINCLIIDEADKLSSSEKIAKYIYKIIDSRYKAGLQTILISNKPLEYLIRLNRTLFEPVLSRFGEKGVCCSLFHVPDYRRILHQQNSIYHRPQTSTLSRVASY